MHKILKLAELVNHDCSSSWEAFWRLADRIEDNYRNELYQDKGAAFRRMELIERGLTPEYLIEHHLDALKRLGADVGMGLIGGEGGTPEEWAEVWLDLACRVPIQKELYGVDVATHLEASIIMMLRLDYSCGSQLRGLPDEAFTRAIALVAVTEHRYAIRYIPERLRDDQVVRWAIKTSPGSIRHLDITRVPEKLLISAVTAEAASIFFIPEDLRTEEIVAAALKNDPGLDIRYQGLS